MMFTRSLEKAKTAYLNRDVEATKVAHSPGQGPELHKDGGVSIKSLVYGGLDGIITTFAVVAGVAGADLSAGIVLILGFANLFADGISMAIGDFLSTRAETEYNEAERARELWEVENYPEGEKLELAELYEAKGIPKEDAEKLVSILAEHKDAWVDVMMAEELGIIEERESPLKNALVTFFSFAIFGFVPLVAYVLARAVPFLAENTFIVACLLTAITLFGLGAQKVRITNKNWFVSGAEMLILGGIAAAAAYGIGALLQGLA
jgi:vacuolar iron transporter family protein